MPLKTLARLLGGGAFVSCMIAGTAMAGEKWPDLPVGIKNGIAAQVGDTAYVGLGSAGTDFYALDLTDPGKGWVKRASFDGPAPNGAAVAVVDDRIFAFSGNGKPTADAASPIIFDTVHVYDTRADEWTRLDTRTPVGLSGAKALPLNDGRIAILGGYNKELFDSYLADVTALDKDKDPEGYKALVNGYMGMPPEDYRWNDEVVVYDPAANIWSSLGSNPFLPNCDAALVDRGEGRFMIISGEIKPGLRTPEVKLLDIGGEGAEWQRLEDLPPLAETGSQEGVAGAYAGMIGDTVLVAGGANFQGARANAEAGNWFAHDGLTKTWRDEVYAFDGREWNLAGTLPHGLAYGASFSVPEGLLVMGGEDGQGTARAEVFLLAWDGRTLRVEN